MVENSYSDFQMIFFDVFVNTIAPISGKKLLITVNADKVGAPGGMHATPGRFLKLGALRSLLRLCLGQNAPHL